VEVVGYLLLGAFESAYLISNKGTDPSTFEVSEQELLDCGYAKTNCVVGGWHEAVFAYLLTLGAVGSSLYQYNVSNPTRGSYCNADFGTRPYHALNWGYISVNDVIPSVLALKRAIISHGPIAVGVTASANWDDPKTTNGVVDGTPSSRKATDVNHEVLIVGWDDGLKGKGFPPGAWIVKNSWSDTWGEKGYIKVPYGADNIGFGASWVSAYPSDSTITATVSAISKQLRDANKYDVLKAFPNLQQLE
jgi:Papain family cysteine protease